MGTIWKNIEAWFAAKGGLAHVVAAVYAGAVLAYAAVPSFQSVVNSVYTATPHWLHESLLAVIGLIAWYKNSQSKPPSAGPSPTPIDKGKE